MTSSSREILLVSSPEGLITAYDASSGMIVAHFTSSRSPRKGLALVGNNLIAASHVSPDTASGSIHLYNWWSPIAFHHLSVPEPVAPLAATPDGLYLFCGGLSGNIHALMLPSRDLFRSFPAHSKPVTCLTINDDASLLISGGDDGAICIFPILGLLDTACNDTAQFSLYQFDAHLSSVTATSIGTGGSNTTIISCSLDCTCKLWNLAYGTHVRTILFPCMIWGFVMDPTETDFYVGGSDGRIYAGVLKVNRRELLNTDSGVVAWAPENDRAITAVAIANGGVNLVSASEDGTVRIWDTKSGQVIRIFAHERGSISDIAIVKGLRDSRGGHDFGLGGSGVEWGGQGLGFSGREIGRPVRELSHMEEMLSIVVKDRRRAIDRLEAAIGTYQRLLGLILKEAKGGGTDSNNSSKDKAAEM
ncbi:hypothetical protein GIB67_001029 [Kingdonia uniflora]|uniref:Uncharacterized protein n=1 Tax=Kingdonia uniflora TaxID=39325 RepID=A0A7J7MFY8_9MAGN|nr:hypothetical protein GIB67_001029 [Kingdonia uniflora]